MASHLAFAVRNKLMRPSPSCDIYILMTTFLLSPSKGLHWSESQNGTVSSATYQPVWPGILFCVISRPLYVRGLCLCEALPGGGPAHFPSDHSPHVWLPLVLLSASAGEWQCLLPLHSGYDWPIRGDLESGQSRQCCLEPCRGGVQCSLPHGGRWALAEKLHTQTWRSLHCTFIFASIILLKIGTHDFIFYF